MLDTWNESDKWEYLLKLLSKLDKRIYWGRGISELNENERIIYVTMSLLQDMEEGGGFAEYFLNSGEYIPELEAAFMAMGAPAAAAICRYVLGFLGGSIPAGWIPRNSMLKEMEAADREKLTLYDCVFRTYMNKLTNLSYDFVLKNQIAAAPQENCRKKPVYTPPAIPQRPNVPNPFRDNPYFFQATGTRIYQEPGNPYETVEVYLDLEPEFMAVKSYIYEHGPDGGSSWHGIFLDAPNCRKLQSAVNEDVQRFLRKLLQENSNEGLMALSRFLKEHEIAFEEGYAF